MQKFKENRGFVELIKGSSITLLIKLTGMIFGYLIMLFITNVYGASEWGLYSLCITVLSISVLLPKFGFDNSLVRIITELRLYNNNNEIKKVLKKSIIISVIVSLTVIVLINFLNDFIALQLLKKSELSSFIPIVSYAIIPLTLIAIMSAYFQALKRTTLFILFQTALINIIFLLLLLSFYVLDIEIVVFKLYVISVFITFLIAIIIYLYSKEKNVNTETGKEISYNYQRIINLSTPMLISSSFALFMSWSDIIMLSMYKTTSDIGIYDSALRLATLSGISLIAINAVVTPKFVEFYSRKDYEGLKDVVQKSTRLIFFTASPILLILIIFSKEILSFFGEDFSIGYLALIYLCISRFINAISGSVGYIMQMTDNQKTYQRVIFIAFLINVILNFILIPKYSYTGAAFASAIAMIFWNLTLVIIIKRQLGFWTFITFKMKRA
ncbi:flippase [Winogradskyella sp. PG-2]|uniref:flippase n=1 Tax=Winogradskyella sp. PG-2 TaxID=754409 RepID=UPI00045893C5|nr:flippase [Winogradskyella sp. PG-2]BAO75576.1 polysaccharide biosynthesis protein [Winogradskyella sp. PG-2]